MGQSVNPAQRLTQHTNTPGNIEKVAWVGGLLNKKEYPQMGIIDCIPIQDSIKTEKAYIHYFIHLERKKGQPHSEVLLNKSLT